MLVAETIEHDDDYCSCHGCTCCTVTTGFKCGKKKKTPSEGVPIINIMLKKKATHKYHCTIDLFLAALAEPKSKNYTY